MFFKHIINRAFGFVVQEWNISNNFMPSLIGFGNRISAVNNTFVKRAKRHVLGVTLGAQVFPMCNITTQKHDCN